MASLEVCRLSLFFLLLKFFLTLLSMLLLRSFDIDPWRFSFPLPYIFSWSLRVNNLLSIYISFMELELESLLSDEMDDVDDALDFFLSGSADC